jgi:excinuclease ABC subunit B
MYADNMTDSMKYAIDETKRRREIQERYNKEHGIVPKTIIKEIRDLISNVDDDSKSKKDLNKLSKKEKEKNIEILEQEMRDAAKHLDFERAMELRDIIFELKSQ